MAGGAGFEATPSREILDNFESWSLFLVCSPAWIVQNKDDGIRDLFEQYKAFGRTIGPNNLAVWFWEEPSSEPLIDLMDVSRSSEYCEKFKLLPSASPYVVSTTQHPDIKEVGEYFIVSMNGLSSKDSANVLSILTDQLLVTGLDQADLDANVRWQRLLTVVVAVLDNVGSYFDKVAFTFNTDLFKAEIAHSG